MATILARRGRSGPLAADTYERILAIGAVVMLIAVVTAIARGHAEWRAVPTLVWLHLATILIALALTPVILLRRRGDARHRVLGKIWFAAMLATAALSLGIRSSRAGELGIIHLLSAYVLIQVPVMWWAARTHRVALHRGAVRGMITGALLIAGFFTFPFHRLLGHCLFG